MKPQTPPSELALSFDTLKPVLMRAAGFSMVISLLALSPTVYMLEVYDRVVNSRSGGTLVMLTVMVILAYAMMEILEKVRGAMMRAAGVQLDEKLSERVYNAMFQGFLKRHVSGGTQVLNDLKLVREFLFNPALLALMEAPIALVALALIFAINPLLGWSAVLGAIAQMGVAYMNERASRKPLNEANRSAAGAQQFAEASLRNAHVMESMGMLDAVHARWQKRQREFLSHQEQAYSAAHGLAAAGPRCMVVAGQFTQRWRQHDDHWIGAGWPSFGTAGPSGCAVECGGECALSLGSLRSTAGSNTCEARSHALACA